MKGFKYVHFKTEPLCAILTASIKSSLLTFWFLELETKHVELECFKLIFCQCCF